MDEPFIRLGDLFVLILAQDGINAIRIVPRDTTSCSVLTFCACPCCCIIGYDSTGIVWPGGLEQHYMYHVLLFPEVYSVEAIRKCTLGSPSLVSCLHTQLVTHSKTGTVEAS